MKRLLFLDTETSSLDPKTGHLLEVGLVRWSVEHRSVISGASMLVTAPSNEAERVNGIPPAVLAEGQSRDAVFDVVRRWASSCDAIVAHNAEFDMGWLPDLGKPWICSCHDISWPGAGLASGVERERERPGQSLVALCLAHGVGVAHAHRALTDCMLLARLFERVAELGHDLGAMLELAMRPKVTVIARVPFEQNHLAKAAGFRWDGDTKTWRRKMAIADVPALPFPTRIAS